MFSCDKPMDLRCTIHTKPPGIDQHFKKISTGWFQLKCLYTNEFEMTLFIEESHSNSRREIICDKFNFNQEYFKPWTQDSASMVFTPNDMGGTQYRCDFNEVGDADTILTTLRLLRDMAPKETKRRRLEDEHDHETGIKSISIYR